ncbi:hypothetical protein QX776_10020 [Alteromonadaceae bacterium BrNp21-10]|nr:hypothetical protein [Alteromonadaceae bacterium BrNp21-10]
MFKAIHKVFITTIMLLAFVSQVFASASMPCEMPQSANQQNATPHHNMVMSATDQQMMQHDMLKQQADCCDVDCHCPASACTSMTLVNGIPLLLKLDLSIIKIQHINGLVPQAHRKSLYRPPIFA